MTDVRPKDRDLVHAWREAERRMAELRPSDALDLRMQARLHGHGISRPALGLALGAAIALGLYLRGSTPAPPPADAATVVFSSPRCAPAHLTSRLALPAGCGIALPDAQVSLRAVTDVEIVHTDVGLRLREGHIDVEVETPAARPFVLLAAEWRLETRGGRFVLEQGEHAGRIAPLAGKIELRAPGVAPRTLGPGDEARWPLALSSAALDRAVAEATRLRSLGQGEAAAEALSALLERPLDPATAEVLSYELGLVLQDDLRDAPAACAHWMRHAAKFPAGRYQTQVSTWTTTCEGNFREAQR